MVNKVFIDTNIFIDLFDAKRLQHQAAIELFNALESNTAKGFVTECVLNTTSYLIRKDYTTGKLKTMFKHLLSFVELVPVSNVTYINALYIATNDIEDAVLYAAALEAKLHLFITSNIKDFKKMETQQLPIITAADFIKKYL